MPFGHGPVGLWFVFLVDAALLWGGVCWGFSLWIDVLLAVVVGGVLVFLESLILAQDERWRRA